MSCYSTKRKRIERKSDDWTKKDRTNKSVDSGFGYFQRKIYLDRPCECSFRKIGWKLDLLPHEKRLSRLLHDLHLKDDRRLK
jgi:hypothetical protein